MTPVRPRSPRLPALLAVTTLLATLVATRPVAAAGWAESPDAGSLPGTAQNTVGIGALTSITGGLSSETDVDMYCITITDLANFRAYLQNCVAFSDPDIWLFDAAGKGVAMADNCQAGQVAISNAYVAGPGTYYLTVSATDGEAYNGASLIWLATVGSERPPDGPAATLPVTGWGGPTFLDFNANYTLILSGAGFCEEPLPTVPTSWGGVKTRWRG